MKTMQTMKTNEGNSWEEVYEMNRIEAFLEEGDREIEWLNKEIDELVDELMKQGKFAHIRRVEVAEVV